MAELLNRTRLVFNVNAVAQAAAIAALGDEAFVRKTYEVNQAGLAQLVEACQRLGLPYVPSSGNFLMVDFSGAPHSATEVNKRLLARGIIVRPLGPYGLPQHLRITVGLPGENTLFIEALDAIFEEDATQQ